jgi:predicted acyl esterase
VVAGPGFDLGRPKPLVRARIRGVIVDTSRRLQSVYVPVGDGVRLAVDVWLPAERTAVGGTVGTVMRVTRYHRAEAPQEPGPEADTNAVAGDLFNGAGFALVVVDARGTGASFGLHQPGAVAAGTGLRRPQLRAAP